MNDDPFMRELAQRVREEQAEDASLPADLVRPLDDAELDKILGGATEVLAANAARAPASARRRAWSGRAARGPSWRLAAGIATPLAAAAIAVLALRGPHPAERDDALVDLPPYALLIEGGERTTRSAAPEDPAAPLRVARDGQLVLLLRPRKPWSDAARARVLVEHAGELLPVSAEGRASSEGAIRIDLRGAAIAALPSGASRLVVLVSDAAHLPADPASVAKALRGEDRSVQALVKPIDVAP
jgi:hypothetical protein